MTYTPSPWVRNEIYVTLVIVALAILPLPVVHAGEERAIMSFLGAGELMCLLSVVHEDRRRSKSACERTEKEKV